MFLSSYRNTVLNQSACAFGLGYFLNYNKRFNEQSRISSTNMTLKQAKKPRVYEMFAVLFGAFDPSNENAST